MNEILQELIKSKHEYYEALSISSDTDFQIHFNRMPKDCFINNYFMEGLESWKANINIQLVINNYKVVNYTCAYFLKAEDEISEATKQVANEAFVSRKSNIEKMKTIALPSQKYINRCLANIN